MLETVPIIRPKNSTSSKDNVKLDYDLCKKRDDYDTIETFGFSWITEMKIECNRTKVGMIGSFVNFGLTTGSLLFSIISKYLTHRQMIIYFVFIYVFFLYLTTIVHFFAFKLLCLFCLGISNSMANMSTMTLVSESVSSKKRSLFTGIINVGNSCCLIMYTPLYVILGKWRYIFSFKIL